MLVSTPDQRTGPFRINVLILTQCYLLRARGISAHFAYTSTVSFALEQEYKNPCGANRKSCRALDSCFGLLGEHIYCDPYLRVFKAEQWRCTCGYEMRFIPTRLCHCYALVRHPSIHGFFSFFLMRNTYTLAGELVSWRM